MIVPIIGVLFCAQIFVSHVDKYKKKNYILIYNNIICIIYILTIYEVSWELLSYGRVGIRKYCLSTVLVFNIE